MQGHVKAHISWEALRGQDRDGKGKNKASNVPYGQLFSNLVSGHEFVRHQVRSFVDDPKHRESLILTPGLADCFQKN